MAEVPYSGLSEELINELADQLVGTCKSPLGLLDRKGLPDVDVANFESDLVFVAGIERCEACEWWFDEGDLDEDLLCWDCREENQDGP